MISSMGTFILTLAFYLVLVSPLFMILYQTESIAFVNSFSMFRSLIDSVLGNFGYYVTTSKALQFQIIIQINVLIANVFLLNYLIAILSTVYANMEEQGDFSYK